MTVKLVPKTPIDQEVQKQTIAVLKEALADAERGEIHSCILLLKRDDGHWSDLNSGTMMFSDAIGKLEIIKQRWIRDYLRDAEG